jgi:hypothetical protein
MAAAQPWRQDPLLMPRSEPSIRLSSKPFQPFTLRKSVGSNRPNSDIGVWGSNSVGLHYVENGLKTVTAIFGELDRD